MRHFLSYTLFLFLSFQAFASEAYKESEVLMQAYINCPTNEKLGEVYTSLLRVKKSELNSLSTCSSQFKDAMYTNINKLPAFTSRVSYFNLKEPVYRNFILILCKLMPELKHEEKCLLKSVCETYATKSNKIPNEVNAAFDMLGELYSFNVRKLSIKQAACFCFEQGRLIDCMDYGVHVFDRFSGQYNELRPKVVYETLGGDPNFVFML